MCVLPLGQISPEIRGMGVGVAGGGREVGGRLLGRVVWEIPGEKQDADPGRMGCSSLSPLRAQPGSVAASRGGIGLAAGPVPGVSLCHPVFISALSQRAPGAGRPQLCLFCCFPVRDKPVFPFFISC